MLFKSVISERRPVWIALSEFYLDIELQDDDLKRIAEIFRLSPYSLYELKEINLDEVGPVLLPNLFSIAGTWSGFEEEWLVESIKKNMDRKRWRPFRMIHRRIIANHTRRYWDKLETL